MTPDEVVVAIGGIIREVHPGAGAVTPSARFQDLGVNSLLLVDIVIEIETAFDVEVPDSAFSSLRTVRDLTDYILDRQR